MFKNLIKKLDRVIIGANAAFEDEEEPLLFNSIYGYEDIKKLLVQDSLSSKIFIRNDEIFWAQKMLFL